MIRIIWVFIMATGLLGAAQAAPRMPGEAEARALVEQYETGKISKRQWDAGRYELMKRFGIEIRDTKDPAEAPADNYAPLAPPKF